MSDTNNVIDERLAQALDASNFRITLQHQKDLSRLKLQNSLLYSLNGGIFVANSNLISFVYTLICMNNTESIILDSNNNPIKIDNLQNFLNDLISIYQENINEHFKEYNRIKSARTTAKVVNW